MKLGRTLFVVAMASAACGDELPQASDVRTLRVFAVSKDPSVARPGQEVTFRMLWHEPREARPTQIAWLSGCWNVEGDLFYGCLPVLGEQVQAFGAGAPPEGVGVGTTFVVRVPDDVVSSRPALPGASAPAFGLGFVFFAACAGTLGPAPEEEAREFPLACFDDAGRSLGPSDFVVGYVQVYASEDGENQSPALAEVQIDGRAVPLDCVGVACVDSPVEPTPIDCTTDDPRCVAACAGADGECKLIAIAPVIDPESFELDPIASAQDGSDRWEQTWVRFYSDRGDLAGDIRIAANPTDGPSDDLAMDFDASEVFGETTLWITVHDSRGGTDWARLRLAVTP